jgi:hypothetical protein
MRFLLWTAAAWTVMFLGILAVDVGYVITTGTVATSAVTQQIDFTPDGAGILGWMEQASRTLDRLGDRAFGRTVGLFEMGLYGILCPLLIAGPLGWEARRRRWASKGAIVLTGVGGGLILLWGLSKSSPVAIYYALVNALLLSCRALGLSYYTGSFVYFIILPLVFGLGYVGVRLGSRVVPRE